MKIIGRIVQFLAVSLIFSSAWAAQVKVIPNNESALRARVDLIKSAKQEILIEYFEVDDDTVSQMGLALLKEAADRGVKVKIIIDDMHSSLGGKHLAAVLSHLEPLRNSTNIEIKVFNPMDSIDLFDQTYRNHDKLFVVDGKYAIIGGRNVSGSYFGRGEFGKPNLRDVDVVIQGEEVSEAQKYFTTLWTVNPHVKQKKLFEYSPEELNKNCGLEVDRVRECESRQAQARAETTKTATRLAKLQKAIDRERGFEESAETTLARLFDGAHSVDLKFLFNDPAQVMKKVKDKLSAQLYRELDTIKPSTISIVTPYLFPTNEALGLFEKLGRENGTKIQIATNSLRSTDSTLVYAAYSTVEERMVQAGIDLFQYNGPMTDSDQNDPEILHAKLMVLNENTDQPILYIGSFNMDQRSALINRELGVKISGKDVKALQRDLGLHISDILSNSTKVSEKGQMIPGATEGLMEKTPSYKINEMQSNIPLVNLLKRHI